MPTPSRGLALPPTAASASTQTLEVGQGNGELSKWGPALFPTLILNQLKIRQQRNAHSTDGRTRLCLWTNRLSDDEAKMRQPYPPATAALDRDCLPPELEERAQAAHSREQGGRGGAGHAQFLLPSSPITALPRLRWTDQMGRSSERCTCTNPSAEKETPALGKRCPLRSARLCARREQGQLCLWWVCMLSH